MFHSPHDDISSDPIPVPGQFPQHLSILELPQVAPSRTIVNSDSPSYKQQYLDLHDRSTSDNQLKAQSKHGESDENQPTPTGEEIERNCCICLSKPKCVVLLPCKHMCLCEDCGDAKSTTLIQDCPLCRKAIRDRLKVYI